jgi:hypothetical protein
MKKYYFTFGCGIDDPHRNCYTVITADSWSDARKIMVSRFGTAWAFQYEENDWLLDPKKIVDFPLIASIYGIDPKREEPITQAELYGLTELK